MTSLSLPRPHTRPRTRSGSLRAFHTAAALLAVALTLVGFHHFFFAGSSYPGRPITPPIRGLVIAHGVTMSVWLVIAFVQPLLVALGRRAAHMRLGRIGAVVALAVLGLGFAIAVRSAQVSPADHVIWSLSPRQFIAVPLFATISFGAFVAVGLAYRRTPHIHRPMMLLATWSVLSASVSRIDALSNLYVGTTWDRVFGPFLFTLILCLALLLVDRIRSGKIDRWFAGGLGVMALCQVLVMQMAATSAWDRLVSWMIL